MACWYPFSFRHLKSSTQINVETSTPRTRLVIGAGNSLLTVSVKLNDAAPVPLSRQVTETALQDWKQHCMYRCQDSQRDNLHDSSHEYESDLELDYSCVDGRLTKSTV